jgi:hypothetical protein
MPSRRMLQLAERRAPLSQHSIGITFTNRTGNGRGGSENDLTRNGWAQGISVCDRLPVGQMSHHTAIIRPEKTLQDELREELILCELRRAVTTRIKRQRFPSRRQSGQRRCPCPWSEPWPQLQPVHRVSTDRPAAKTVDRLAIRPIPSRRFVRSCQRFAFRNHFVQDGLC